jgi:hypothetical protein
MFVNRIKICPDLHKLQLWFSRLRQCLFLKLLRQWTHKMGHFLSTIKHSHPICIWYTNFDLAFGSSLYIRYRLAAHVLSIIFLSCPDFPGWQSWVYMLHHLKNVSWINNSDMYWTVMCYGVWISSINLQFLIT